MPKARPMRRKNGTGSVVKLSGRRREPYEVRVNTRMDERNYPVYDVLGRYAERDDAMAALIEYNRNPYDIDSSKLTFAELYELWFDRKYNKSKRKYSQSSITCTRGAYNKCSALYDMPVRNIKAEHMQAIIDDYTLSHAYMEHIKNLFNQMFKYAMEYDYIIKDYSRYVQITKEDDDEHGVPFTQEDIKKLWDAYNSGVENADSVLILIYSGWRIGELLRIKVEDIDIENGTYKGGIKTKAGKNRIVPIHSKIAHMVANRQADGWYNITAQTFRVAFDNVLLQAGIPDKHTPHDCRHTFVTLLSNAGADEVCIKRLVGHSSGNDVTEKIYTHKDIEQLRKAIEMIKD